uniref:hypothetical protein n=1 Tax=uncultured Endozoicomonas sp. TaxID=432652 RepID=UPI002636A2C8
NRRLSPYKRADQRGRYHTEAAFVVKRSFSDAFQLADVVVQTVSAEAHITAPSDFVNRSFNLVFQNPLLVQQCCPEELRILYIHIAISQMD